MSYMEELDRQAQKDKKRFEGKGKLNTAQAWNLNAYGSAPCAHSSWESILDAYNEYKSSCEW